MAGHPLRSATDRRLGRLLPHQLANQTRVHLIPPECFHTAPCGAVRLCGFTSRFQLLSPCMRQVTHALLTRPPLSHKIINPEGNQIECFVRLACVKHAASVHPEPGSNSHVIMLLSQKVTFLCEPSAKRTLMRAHPVLSVKTFNPSRIKSGFKSETMSCFSVLRLLLL